MIEIKDFIRNVPDFPKKGIMFKDITPALENNECLALMINKFYEQFKESKIDKIAVIESRGYLFGAPLACKLNCGLSLIRKPGKLPAKTISESYDLEYGSNVLEIHSDTIKNGENVLIIDDLLATGGTAEAACKLVKRLGGNIVASAFLIELKDLKGREKLEKYGSVWTALIY